MPDDEPRFWGIWSRGKLELLGRYLEAFATASKGQSERVYLDLFGGQPLNADRLALRLDNPPFTRLRFFELAGPAERLATALTRDFPGRDLGVVPGDCNQTVPTVLAELHQWRWAPSFAFIDPNGPDVAWDTLAALARFKPAHLTKTELWLLFATGMFTRMLPRTRRARPEDAERITRLFGTAAWEAIYTARVAGQLEAGEARDGYVNLIRYRLHHILGYQWVHPLRVDDEIGRPLYFMLFATDHGVDRIMRDLYARAAAEFPAMRQQARRHRQRLEPTSEGSPTCSTPPASPRTWRPAGANCSTSTSPPGPPTAPATRRRDRDPPRGGHRQPRRARRPRRRPHQLGERALYRLGTLAPASRRAYSTVLRDFTDWCRYHQLEPCLPAPAASPPTYATWPPPD